ncbi:MULTISPECIES: helix-turn-helix transcriptional regulator [Aeromonas]|uniref:helix-turn-helix transcriptional regulator n=1 Tax=Aeromonas TaxID=642 RepID=UPI00191F5C71|nr:AlpA family phage regulatory protein [Aeromonas veronii]MBL0444960.1 AlpA family phage regulatory protein [Aeromonas veronii]MCJ8220103.1 AlpA family phage regulatory protein [Aeromonas veronii]
MNQPNTILISEASLRKKLEISRATIYRWRKNNPNFPKAVHIGPRAIRYDLAAVEAFIAKLSEGEIT